MPRFYRTISIDDRHLPPQGRQILDRMIELSEASDNSEGWVNIKDLIKVISDDIESERIDSVQEASNLVGYYQTKFLDRNYIEVQVVKAEPKPKVSAKLSEEEKAARRAEKKAEKKAKKGKKTAADIAYESAAASYST